MGRRIAGAPFAPVEPECVSMRMILFSILLTASACDGPREDAGEAADFNAGAVNSEDTLRSGPAEELGERQDAAAQAIEEAKDARADALETAADQTRDQADEKARELEEQAKQIRSN